MLLLRFELDSRSVLYLAARLSWLVSQPFGGRNKISRCLLWQGWLMLPVVYFVATR